MSIETGYTPPEAYLDNKEKQKLISLKNFDIFRDKGIEGIIDKEDLEVNLSKIKEQIDNILGQKQDLGEGKINIHLFSDRSEYEKFLKQKFPNRFETYVKDNAIFDQNPQTLEKTIANYTPTMLSEQDRQKAREYGMDVKDTEGMVTQIARANILSGVAHEMTHLHPFFGGVGNVASPTKWEQEMVCEFVGEKVRTQQGNQEFRQKIFEQAQHQLEGQNELDLEKDGNNWEKFDAYERFFYPYLEKQYGLPKLQILWKKLFQNPKKPLSQALESVYEKGSEDIQKEFRAAVLAKKSHVEIENI